MTKRRDFLKTTGAALGAMAVAGVGSIAAEAQGSQSIPPDEDLESSRLALSALREDPTFDAALKDLLSDPGFEGALDKLDTTKLSRAFDSFDNHVVRYNGFHRMERRLWSVKLGKGTVPKELETALRNKSSAAKQAFQDAFGAIDTCLETIEQCGLDKVLDRHLTKFTGLLAIPNHPFREAVVGHFVKVGCSQAMVKEFDDSLGTVNYDIVKVVGNGKFSNLRGRLREGVQAQVSILDYTKDHGLDYLRGQCGPPSWAVVVVQVLAYFGISVSAWWVVAAVAVVIALLITLCATGHLPDSILSKCRYLSVKLGFSF